MRVPGTALVRITQQARGDWHARIEQLGKSQAAQLEVARRQAQTAAAGKRAANSHLHISNRRKAIKRQGTRATRDGWRAVSRDETIVHFPKPDAEERARRLRVGDVAEKIRRIARLTSHPGPGGHHYARENTQAAGPGASRCR